MTKLTTERTIILHYHLFKNAGTSVDAILKCLLGKESVTSELPGMGFNNTPFVEQSIRETPDDWLRAIWRLLENGRLRNLKTAASMNYASKRFFFAEGRANIKAPARRWIYVGLA
jgi:hypothetical protein